MTTLEAIDKLVEGFTGLSEDRDVVLLTFAKQKEALENIFDDTGFVKGVKYEMKGGDSFCFRGIHRDGMNFFVMGFDEYIKIWNNHMIMKMLLPEDAEFVSKISAIDDKEPVLLTFSDGKKIPFNKIKLVIDE